MATMVALAAAAIIDRDGQPLGGMAGGHAPADTDAHHLQHPPPQHKLYRSSKSLPDNNETTSAAAVSSYAFITHSQEGLRENKPPMIDNAGLARRRRRRTSQHDQAILEEEYRKCDRPDKARRREIAAMVEMGDKEVQVSHRLTLHTHCVIGDVG